MSQQRQQNQTRQEVEKNLTRQECTISGRRRRTSPPERHMWKVSFLSVLFGRCAGASCCLAAPNWSFVINYILLYHSLVQVPLYLSVRMISDSTILLKQIGRRCVPERSSLSARWASTGYGNRLLSTTVIRVYLTTSAASCSLGVRIKHVSTDYY